MRVPAVAAAFLLSWATLAPAAPLQIRELPADSQWLLFVDVDAMQSSEVIQKLYQGCIEEFPQASEMFEKIRSEFGIDLRKDLHSMTYFGTKYAPHSGVLIVRTEVDKEVLLGKARKAPDHNTVKYRDYEIHTWTDHKGRMGAHEAAGVFYKPEVLVFAGSLDDLKNALDVLDGKKKSLADEKSPLADKVPEGAMFLARAVDIKTDELPGKQPILDVIQQLSYVEGQHDGKWFGRLMLQTKSNEAAEQVKDVLQGFLSMVGLYFSEQPKLGNLLKEVDLKASGKKVQATFEAPVDKVTAAMPEVCDALTTHMKQHAEMHKRMEKTKPDDGRKEPRPKKKRGAPL